MGKFKGSKSSLLSFFLQMLQSVQLNRLSICDFFFFFLQHHDQTWCCKLRGSGTFLCWSSDSSPFINTFYQQPWDFPQGAVGPCQNDTATRPTRNTKDNSVTFPDMDTGIQHVCARSKNDQKNRTFSWHLSALGPGLIFTHWVRRQTV